MGSATPSKKILGINFKYYPTMQKDVLIKEDTVSMSITIGRTDGTEAVFDLTMVNKSLAIRLNCLKHHEWR